MFILTEEVLKPSSRFLNVEMRDFNEMFVSLVGRPDVTFTPQDLLDDPSLDEINNYAPNENNDIDFEPHRWPKGV